MERIEEGGRRKRSFLSNVQGAPYVILLHFSSTLEYRVTHLQYQLSYLSERLTAETSQGSQGGVLAPV